MSLSLSQTFVELPRPADLAALQAAVRDYLAAGAVDTTGTAAATEDPLEADWSEWTDPITGVREVHVIVPHAPAVEPSESGEEEADKPARPSVEPSRWAVLVERTGGFSDAALARHCSACLPNATVHTLDLLGGYYAAAIFAYRGGRVAESWISPAPAAVRVAASIATDATALDDEVGASEAEERYAGADADIVGAGTAGESGRVAAVSEGNLAALGGPDTAASLVEGLYAQWVRRAPYGPIEGLLRAPLDRVPMYDDVEAATQRRLRVAGIPSELFAVRPLSAEALAEAADVEVAQTTSMPSEPPFEVRIFYRQPSGLSESVHGVAQIKSGWWLVVDIVATTTPGGDTSTIEIPKARPSPADVSIDAEGVSSSSGEPTVEDPVGGRKSDDGAEPSPSPRPPRRAHDTDRGLYVRDRQRTSLFGRPVTRKRYTEVRVLAGRALDDGGPVTRRLLDLEEAYCRRVLTAHGWGTAAGEPVPRWKHEEHDLDDWLPVIDFRYALSRPAVTETLAEHRASRDYGYWDLFDEDTPKLSGVGLERRAIAWVRETYPHVTLDARPVEFGFTWSRGDEHELHAHLDNLYRKYLLTDPDDVAWDDLMGEHFDAMFSIHTGEEDLEKNPLELEPGIDPQKNLEVRVIPEAYGAGAMGRIVTRPIVPGLRACLGLARASGSFRFLRDEDLAQLGITVEAAFTRALENLSRSSPGPPRTADEVLGIIRTQERDPGLPDARSPYQQLLEAFETIDDPTTGGRYARGYFRDGNAAARILLPELGRIVSETVGRGAAVAVPMRDEIFLIPEEPVPLRERLRRDVRFLAGVGPYPITADLLAIDETGIAPWQPAGAAPLDDIPEGS